MLLLALSCLQGQGQWQAAETLLSYQPDGLQLTPGNKPDWPVEALERLVFLGQDVPRNPDSILVNRHQGHDFNKAVAPVYGKDGNLRWRHGSIHANAHWREIGLTHTVETMYPKAGADHGLVTTLDYAQAIDRQTLVALDLSHADIAIRAGVLSRTAVEAMLYQGNVQELHVSANNGISDTHSPLNADYHWLRDVETWVRRRPGQPVVLECYFHKLTDPQRQQQVDLFANCRMT